MVTQLLKTGINRILWMVLLSVPLVHSCTDSPPLSNGIPSAGPAEQVVCLEMADSASLYDISLVVRYARNSSIENICLKVSVISPSGERGSERVSLPSDYRYLKEAVRKKIGIDMVRGRGYYDVSYLYRSRITPAEYGEWKIVITPESPADGVLGIGVICSAGERSGRLSCSHKNF